MLTLYDWLVTYVLPMFGDVSLNEYIMQDFNTIYWIVVSCVIVHFCVYVPYRLILRLIHWKRWRDG